jgi:hypothetical protein
MFVTFKYDVGNFKVWCFYKRLQETQSHVFIIANWKRALYKVFFSRYPHLSFISLIHNPLILRSVFSLSRALYNLSHLYYPLYHFRDVFLCFQILFITKALFFTTFGCLGPPMDGDLRHHH